MYAHLAGDRGITVQMQANKTGLALATLLGGWHLLWAILVATGTAQMVIDFVFWMHFLKPVYVVGPFQVLTAAVLVLVTAALGYAIGFAFAVAWNWIHK
jgi:hypothetical protein